MRDAGEHGFTVAIAGAAMLLAYVGITAFGGASDEQAEAVAADSVTDRPLSTSGGGRDSRSPGGTFGAGGSTASIPATGSTASSNAGTARGTFAVKLLKDGKEITTLTGELVEVRSGTYQVMLSTPASWAEGPWTTQFAVVSTS